ncbi:MAG TPA: hypothetical protein VII45_05860 [Solirubrobacterales bacterium]
MSRSFPWPRRVAAYWREQSFKEDGHRPPQWGAFTTVVQLRAADTSRAVAALDRSTETLNKLTWVLVVLGRGSLVIALVALVVAL